MGGIVEILQSRAVGCEVKQVFSPEKVTTVVVSAAPTESLKTESPRQEGLTTQQKSQIAIRWREASKVIHGSRPRLSLQLECRPTAAAAAVPRMASLLCRPRIISMQKGGDVRGVFERLARGIKTVQDSVKAES